MNVCVLCVRDLQHALYTVGICIESKKFFLIVSISCELLYVIFFFILIIKKKKVAEADALLFVLGCNQNRFSCRCAYRRRCHCNCRCLCPCLWAPSRAFLCVLKVLRPPKCHMLFNSRKPYNRVPISNWWWGLGSTEGCPLITSLKRTTTRLQRHHTRKKGR